VLTTHPRVRRARSECSHTLTHKGADYLRSIPNGSRGAQWRTVLAPVPISMAPTPQDRKGLGIRFGTLTEHFSTEGGPPRPQTSHKPVSSVRACGPLTHLDGLNDAQTSPKASPADTPESATRLTAPDGHLRRHGPELVIATRTDLTWLVYGRVSDRGNISRHREQMALSGAAHLSKPAKSGHTAHPAVG
jgi:hypothetical protein